MDLHSAFKFVEGVIIKRFGENSLRIFNVADIRDHMVFLKVCFNNGLYINIALNDELSATKLRNVINKHSLPFLPLVEISRDIPLKSVGHLPYFIDATALDFNSEEFTFRSQTEGFDAVLQSISHVAGIDIPYDIQLKLSKFIYDNAALSFVQSDGTCCSLSIYYDYRRDLLFFADMKTAASFFDIIREIDTFKGIGFNYSIYHPRLYHIRNRNNVVLIYNQ